MTFNRLFVWKIAIAVGLLFLGLLFLTTPPGSNREGASNEITLYCAAGVKPPIVDAAKAFEKRYGVRVHLEFGGSGTLLSRIAAAPLGDLYLAADASYTNIAIEKGLLESPLRIATMRPVIAVAKGNPKGISTLDDLERDDVRVSLGNPEAASIGKLTKQLLTESGHLAKIHANVLRQGVYKPTVPEVATDVAIGTADAAIIWDATALQFKSLAAIQVDAWTRSSQYVSVGVLTSSAQPELATQFAQYLQSTECRQFFKAKGYGIASL